MDLYSIIFIAIGLAMDAFAVSITSGAVVDRIKFRYGLKVASSFGFFQAIMPIFGWLAGRSFFDMIRPADTWVAFILLLTIGIKMIYNSFQKIEKKKIPKLSGKTLLLLSIATSIDALAVGLSLSLVNVNIFIPALIIGITTLFLSMVGMFIGKHVGHLFGNRAELLGGAILILIGFKILLTTI